MKLTHSGWLQAEEGQGGTGGPRPPLFPTPGRCPPAHVHSGKGRDSSTLLVGSPGADCDAALVGR